MRFREIASRLTGLSTPVFGVSWKPEPSDVEKARRVVTFLEDRRVLYVPSMMEVPDHCVRSVLEIRRFLTEELQALPPGSPLAEPLRAMRAASRKFLAYSDRWPDPEEFSPEWGAHWPDWEFNQALGELRGVFGVHLAALAAAYGLDVEDELASIIPPADDDLCDGLE